jgi:hypothetical protein
MSTQAKILEQVAIERAAQDHKWGQQNHPDGTGDSALGMASGFRQLAAQVATRHCNSAFAAGVGTWLHILNEEVAEAFAEHEPAKLRAELVQVAAVAVAWVENIDRRAA